MKLINKQTQEVEDVSEEHAQQAFLSGKYALPSAAPVPVVGEDGTVGTVAPEEAQATLEAGGRFAGAEEFHKASVEAKYGGLGGQAIAGAEGLARGASLGLSDPIAIGAGHLFGGEKGAQAVREHLGGEKEANPWTSTIGEVGGAILPTLATGGAGAALEAPEAAGVVARIGEGVRTLGALPRSVQAIGDVAEHGIGSMLGDEATSALGRAGQSAAKAAVRGITEGGLFGAGQEISQGSIDNDLTAEKVMASVGHGALLGGALGAGLGAVGKLAGEGAQRFLGGASEKLDDAAGHQAWKWLNPGKHFSEEAEARAGGVDAVGRTVFDRVLRPLVEKDGLAGAAVSSARKLELIQDAVGETGTKIGEVAASYPDAVIPLSDMTKPIDELAEKFRGTVGGEDKVAAMERLKASVLRVLAPDLPEAAVGASVGVARRTPAEMGEFLRSRPDILEKYGAKSIPDSFWYKGSEVAGGAQAEASVPLAEAMKQRRGLQQIAYEESKAIDPKLRVQLLRDVTSAWGDTEQRVLDDVSAKAGDGLAGQQLKALNKEFQQLKIAEKATQKNLAAYQTNNTLSLTDTLVGTAHAPAMLLAGHPLGAAGLVASSFANKFARTHGNAYAALLLDRLSTWGGVSRATSEIDEQVGRSLNEALSGSSSKARIGRGFIGKTPDETQNRYDAERSRVAQMANLAPGLLAAHLTNQTQPIGTHAPELQAALQQKTMAATSFLASKLPPEQPANPQTGHTQPIPPAQAVQAKFLRYVDAVQGGPPHIAKALAQGTLTPEAAEAARAVYPKWVQELSTQAAGKTATRKTALPYQKRLQLSMLTATTPDKTLDRAFGTALQQQYAAAAKAQQGSGQGQGGAPKKSRAPAQLSVAKNFSRSSDRIMGN